MFRILPEAWEYAANLNAAGEIIGREIAIENGINFVQFSPEDEVNYISALGDCWELWVSDAESKKAGANVREYIADCIAFRDKLTGEPFTIYTP